MRRTFGCHHTAPVCSLCEEMNRPRPGQVWRHKNGSLYTVLLVTNVAAQRDRRGEYPMTVVYTNAAGQSWSRTLDRWYGSFKLEPSISVVERTCDCTALCKVLTSRKQPVDVIADEAARDINLMWGQDRTDFEKKIAHRVLQAMYAPKFAQFPPGWDLHRYGEYLKVTKPDGSVSAWVKRPATPNTSGMYDLCMAILDVMEKTA